MGCGALDYRQQAQQMELRTGGMSVSTQVVPDSTQLDVYEQVSARCSVCVNLVNSPVWLQPDACWDGMVGSLCDEWLSLAHLFQGVLLSSSCLERNLPHMFQLWTDMFNRCVPRLPVPSG